jgi:hypothetical protein
LKSTSKSTGRRANEKRRSSRILLKLELLVECQAEGGKILVHEETYTQMVSLFGTLIVLVNPVEENQKLVLTNPSGVKKECRAVYLGPDHGERAEVGLAFAAPAVEFWHIGPALHFWRVSFPRI